MKKQIKNELAQEFMDFVEAHPEKDWDWAQISRNQNLTMDFIEAHLDKNWDWWEISKNPLNYEQRYIDKIHKHLMAFRIQCKWRRAYYNPEHQICKNRLIREAKEFGFE